MTRARAKLTALRAGLGSVSRVNVDHVDALPSSFVFDKALELAKGPRVVRGSLFFAHFCPVSYVRQVFQHYCVSWLKRIYDLLADTVIQVTHPALFSARQPFQHPARGCSAFSLERLADCAKLTSDVHGLFAAELEPCAGAGKVGNTNVYANGLPLTPSRIGRRTFFGQHDVDIKLALTSVIERCRSRLLASQPAALVVANVQPDLAPARHSADVRSKVVAQHDQTEQVVVQIERRRSEQLGLAPLVLSSLNRTGYTREAAANVVRRKTIAFFERVVALVVQGNVVGDSLLKCYIERIVARLRILKQRIQQRSSVIRCDLELAFHGLYEFHDS